MLSTPNHERTMKTPTGTGSLCPVLNSDDRVGEFSLPLPSYPYVETSPALPVPLLLMMRETCSQPYFIPVTHSPDLVTLCHLSPLLCTTVVDIISTIDMYVYAWLYDALETSAPAVSDTCDRCGWRSMKSWRAMPYLREKCSALRWPMV